MKKNKKTIIITIIIIVIITAVVVYRKNLSGAPSATVYNDNTPAPKITADTLQENKAPLVYNQYAKKIQEEFNQLAAYRKTKGITPELVPLVVDGLYGSKTSSAVKLLMGKDSVTYNEWSTFILPLIAMITNVTT